MMERSHDELKVLVAAYVLGAVPPEEVRLVRSHILTCDECMAEADGYSGALDSLALAVEPVEVPSGFADKVMAQVAAQRQAATGTQQTVAPVPARPSWLQGLRSRLVPLAAGMAALIAVAVLGAGYVRVQQDLDQTEDVLAQIIRSDESLELRGDSGTVAHFAPTQEGAVLAVSGLPEAPGSDIYQLWYMKDGVPTGVGTFETTDGVLTMQLEHSFDGYDAVAVTVEPPGGSRRPTSDPVIGTF